jgi:antitoxin ParD1/3/4
MGREDEDAIDPEFVIPDKVLRRKIQEAYDDPRPSIPAEKVFEELRLRHALRMKSRNASRSPR